MEAVFARHRVPRRDRALITVGLGAITLLAWIYLLRSAHATDAIAADTRIRAAMGMADSRVWGLVDWFGLFTMWAVMMAAMMLPSALPVILLVLGVYRRRNDPRASVASIAFVAGYAVAWTAFSLMAAAAQIWLHGAALLAPDMRLGSRGLAAAILIGAGVYQWLPVKSACLTQCQSPLAFLSQHWREGAGGGFALGLRHGLFCVGCCWLLMLVLFVVGVMNLLWVAALAAVVLIERLLRRGALVARMVGAAAAAWGIYLLAVVS